ncbi:hypothetical protein BY996DRAFT_6423930 [Phakopsora pachyrhizi]|uniref:Expressed protein n=1 Tax=Phakopsora pachyrhizi TaxID=170000 RepID=A0AAV0B0J1_PHAPC|nr:hypothetical protein BY996DRAFT_6423930 [Phakopsora pachyrhizi]CAH7675409.1 expressed protein [Phakopsora pachyrhizi]
MNLNQQTVAAEASSSSSPSIIRFLSSPISYHNHSNRQDDLQLQLRTPSSVRSNSSSNQLPSSPTTDRFINSGSNTNSIHQMILPIMDIIEPGASMGGSNSDDISADQMMEIEQPVFNSTMNFAGSNSSTPTTSLRASLPYNTSCDNRNRSFKQPSLTSSRSFRHHSNSGLTNRQLQTGGSIPRRSCRSSPLAGSDLNSVGMNPSSSPTPTPTGQNRSFSSTQASRMIDGRGSHSRLPRGSDGGRSLTAHQLRLNLANRLRSIERSRRTNSNRRLIEMFRCEAEKMGDTNSLNSRGVKSKGNDKTYWEGQDRPFEEEELRILEALDRREMARLRRELRERLEENVMMTELEFDKILEEEYHMRGEGLDLDEIEEEEDPYEIYQSLCLNDQEQWQDQGQRRGVEGDDEYDYPVGDDDLEMMMAIET